MFKGSSPWKANYSTYTSNLRKRSLGGKVVCQIEIKWFYVTKLEAFRGSSNLQPVKNQRYNVIDFV